MLDQSDSNLKRSLGLVSAYTSVDEEMTVSYYYHTIKVFKLDFKAGPVQI